jgi:hypothetical protein
MVLSANTVLAAEAPPASSERFAFVTSEADDSLAIIDRKTEKMIKNSPYGENTGYARLYKNRQGLCQ